MPSKERNDMKIYVIEKLKKDGCGYKYRQFVSEIDYGEKRYSTTRIWCYFQAYKESDLARFWVKKLRSIEKRYKFKITEFVSTGKE